MHNYTKTVKFAIFFTFLFMQPSRQPYAFHFLNVHSMHSTECRIVPSVFLKNHNPPFGFNLRELRRERVSSCITPAAHPGELDRSQSIKREKKLVNIGDKSSPRIAIVGGGICGVTAAKAISTRIKTIAPDQKLEITVFESDPGSCSKGSTVGGQPKWKAATARNANSVVPGAAFHIMSQRRTLLDIVQDTVREHYLNVRDGDAGSRNFSEVPPYFGFSLSKCLGWSASWEERLSFVNFFLHFVKSSLLTGEGEAERRGKIMVQLAKANRFALKQELGTMQNDHIKIPGIDGLENHFGLQEGFISVHRTKQQALHKLEELSKLGEEAEIITSTQALELEPKISDLPFKDAHFVHRKHDFACNCAEFVRSMIQSLKSSGIQYRVDCPVRSIRRDKDGSFSLTTDDGDTDNFDFVVIAAGIYTPILAMKIGATQSCPVYPLRGYSLTVPTRPSESDEVEGNYLRKAMSFDRMYCTSVAKDMIRMAGFGEIVGYPKAAEDSAPSPGPRVLEKYAKFIVGEDAFSEIANTTVTCFRPLSPDDIPLVGSVKGIPGLFLHTGHGTLGWTLSLATAHCLSQDVCDKIVGAEDRESYVLPDGSSMDRDVLSPNRFAFSLEFLKPTSRT